jgi:hypothetical protein
MQNLELERWIRKKLTAGENAHPKYIITEFQTGD